MVHKTLQSTCVTGEPRFQRPISPKLQSATRIFKAIFKPAHPPQRRVLSRDKHDICLKGERNELMYYRPWSLVDHWPRVSNYSAEALGGLEPAVPSAPR